MFDTFCIKALNGKAGVICWKEDMVFKPEGEEMTKALSLKGSEIFEPMSGWKMDGWVQLSYKYSKQWKKLAEIAIDIARRTQ